jgi:hypothetical protein
MPGEPWLLTTTEIENIGKPIEPNEQIDAMQKSLDYVLSEVERKKTRNQNYAEKQLRNPNRYIRLFIVKNKELSKSDMLNNTDKAFLFDVLPYINRDNNLITDDRGIPMTAKKICSEFKISKSVFYTIMKKLIENEVISQVPDENKVFFKLNPEYFEY